MTADERIASARTTVRQTRTIDAAIFDCDGILVDSERPWLELMAEHLVRLGARTTAPETFRGLSAAEAVAGLRAAAPDPHPLPTVAEIDRAYAAALRDLCAPMPGAAELVRAMAGAIPIAVASNGRRADVRGLLERAGLLDCFDAIVTIDDVDEGKPSPAIYLLAARELGVSASAATALEDSPVGSRAAAAAGCSVIGVNGDPRIRLTAEVRLSDLEQLRFDASARTLHITPPA